MLLDCPPSLGVLTVAALTAADGVLIPLQCETLSHRGVGQLLDTVHDVRRFTNRDLEVWGVLPTLYDGRTNHARTVLETISETYDLDVIEPPIPKTIRFAEAPAAGRSILATSRSSKGAQAYREVAENLAARPHGGAGEQAPGRGEQAPGGAGSPTALRARNPHRAEVRPRYGRIVTLDVLACRHGRRRGRRSGAAAVADRRRRTVVVHGSSAHPAGTTSSGADPDLTTTPRGERRPPTSRARRRRRGRRRGRRTARPSPAQGTRGSCSARAGSGCGWSTTAARCVRTYLVSGSVYDNLDPGTSAVYSRSRGAVGIDDSGTMKYFVRFTTGDEGAAIGFHDIPIDDGQLVQTVAELGTPQSHGCIRQATPDAIALWDFAPIGTTVVVTA